MPTRQTAGSHRADTDLRTAVDMGIDGNIYVLHNNGKLDKYYGGERVPFAVTRVPRPLSGGNALYLDVEEATQYIYVADASERRIVQLDREGAFVRQLQPSLGQEDLFRQLVRLVRRRNGRQTVLCRRKRTLYHRPSPRATLNASRPARLGDHDSQGQAATRTVPCPEAHNT